MSRLVLVLAALILTTLIAYWFILTHQLLTNIEALQIIRADLSSNDLSIVVLNKGTTPTKIILIVIENISGSWTALGHECTNITVNPNQPITLNCTLPTQTVSGNIYVVKISTLRHTYTYYTKSSEQCSRLLTKTFEVVQTHINN